jgi:uncharacterized tellurite resistance protein B-like protein
MLRDPKPVIEQVTNKILSMPNPTLFFARFSTMNKASKALGQLSFVEVDASGMLIPKHIICIQLPTDKGAVVLLGGSLSEDERLEVFELFNKEGWIDSITLPQGARPLLKRSSKPAVDKSAGDIKTQKEKSEKAKTKENHVKIFETLMDAICCVMCADRKVTTRERKAVHKILEKTKAPWDPNEIDKRINCFIQHVKKEGLNVILEETCIKLPEFRKRRREQVLLRCLDYMTQADGIIDDREREICQRFTSILGTESGSITKEEDPSTRLEKLISIFDCIPLPLEQKSGFNTRQAMMRLRDKLAGSLKFLRGGTDSFGGRPSPSGIGYLLCQLCRETLDNPDWSTPVKTAIGDKAWSELSRIFQQVEDIGRQLQKK